MDFRLIPMLGKKRSKAGQETVGLWLAIYLVDDFGRGELGLFQKSLADVFWKLLFQTIAHESSAQYGSTSFVAEDVT